MLLQIFAAWPAPGAAGVDHRLAHVVEQGPGALERLVAAADHEGEAARFGRGDAARDRARRPSHSPRRAAFSISSRAVATSIVEQSIRIAAAGAVPITELS